MPNVFQLMPSLEGDEMAFVQELIKDMDESHAQQRFERLVAHFRLRNRDDSQVSPKS